LVYVTDVAYHAAAACYSIPSRPLAATANQTGKPNNNPIQVSRTRAVKIKKPHNRTNAMKIEASDGVGKEVQIMIRNYSEIIVSR
jgi:hypothetical protein